MSLSAACYWQSSLDPQTLGWLFLMECYVKKYLSAHKKQLRAEGIWHVGMRETSEQGAGGLVRREAIAPDLQLVSLVSCVLPCSLHPVCQLFQLLVIICSKNDVRLTYCLSRSAEH